MALQAGKSFHADPVYTFVLMAILAGVLIGAEIMQRTLVAVFAFNPLHKNMPCMPIGFVHCHGTLGDVVHVALFAGHPGLLTAMSL